MERDRPAVVLDTNVFVAAGFKWESDAARVVGAVRDGQLRMVWDDATRRETRAILERIPPLSWQTIAGLFREEERFRGETWPDRFRQIPDPDDRKFAALAHAAGAILVSLDDDLLADPHRIAILVLTPSQLVAEGWASVRRSP